MWYLAGLRTLGPWKVQGHSGLASSRDRSGAHSTMPAAAFSSWNDFRPTGCSGLCPSTTTPKNAMFRAFRPRIGQRF